MMSGKYLDQFIDGLKFFQELNPSYPFDFELARGTLQANQQPERFEMYQKVRAILKTMCAHRIKLEGGPMSMARRCHVVSHSFLNWWQKIPELDEVELHVTIGNVYFRGESLYPVTRESLKATIDGGPKVGEQMNLHVWLTVEDLTVVDLTLLPSLARRGIFNAPLTNDSTTVFWNERDKSDFLYEPLLIHNNFFNEVDLTLTMGR